MRLDLNQCFPESSSGERGPLPKQAEFLSSALDPQGPKYVLYCGGIGSGKTLIGCITILSMAVMYPGDYLICRQFMPELRDTTMKTFKEICPPSLIAEERIADALVKIRSTGGKTSTIMFRQLEEPDKLRSLNLSGFYIDEASQTTDAAFQLLQGRLRGGGLRKGIMTTNSGGHDYLYRWFVKQDFISNPAVKAQFRLIKAPSTENVHLPEGYVETMLNTWSKERIEREIMASFDSFEGAVYHEFRRDVHVIQPFDIPNTWTRFVGADHGFRNPAAWIWGAQDYDGNVYIYREFYRNEWLIEEICKGKGGEPGVIALNGRDKLEQIRIDPSTRAVRGQSGESDWDVYLEHLPKHFPLLPANNEVETGIDRVKSYLKVNERTGKPRLFIFNTCGNLIEEMSQYRYEETPTASQGKKNEKESPRKYNDHAVDALRYAMMSRPEMPKLEDEMKKKRDLATLEGSLQRELHSIRKPTPKDPFGDE